VPSSASTDSAAATLAVRTSRSASARNSAASAPLLCLERDRLHAGGGERLASRHIPSVHLDPAPTDQREGEMCERREIARGPEAPLFGHDRVDTVRQHLEQPVDEQRPAPAVPQRQRVRAEQEHRAYDLARERRPDPGGVAHQEVLLEPRGLVRFDDRRGQVAEAGGHAIHDLPLGDEGLDDVARFLHPAAGVVIETRWRVAPRDRLHVVDRQVRARQDDGFGHGAEDSPLCSPPCSTS
jgi:hypothetical protein